MESTHEAGSVVIILPKKYALHLLFLDIILESNNTQNIKSSQEYDRDILSRMNGKKNDKFVSQNALASKIYRILLIRILPAILNC